MTTSPRRRAAGELCSAFSRNASEDPGGSAPSWTRCLVIELAKPWRFDVVESSQFPEAVAATLARAEANGAPTRLQCVVPDPEYSVAGLTRVMLFTRPHAPLSGFEKVEYVVPDCRTGDLAQALVEEPGRLPAFDQYLQDVSGTRDILVCTHGTRDVCCASIGYPVYQVLRHRYGRELSGSLRVWRVSHLGGHKFAPNIVDMPEGRNWVSFGEEHLEALVTRRGDPAELRPFYRGWLALDSPYEQIAERDAFMAEGWGWTRRSISTQTLAGGANGHQAEVEVVFSDPAGGSVGEFRATVKQTDSVPTAGCLGSDNPGEAPQYAVSQLTRSP